MAGLTVRNGHQTVDHAADAPQDHIQHVATPHFVITYNRGIGANGPAIAQRIAAKCEHDFTTLQTYFGGITPAAMPFQIRITRGNTGASHQSCLGTVLSIGALSAPAGDPDFIPSLVVAEADEVFMATFGHGWDCGASNGEGLSRVLANDLYPGTEPPGFVSPPVWLSNGRPDFVNNTDSTDTNYISIGCSVLFLNWLHSQLGHSWHDIIQAGGPTLADTYKNLGLQGDGWTQFRDFIQLHFPAGQPVTLQTDNPFPL
ncbi:MAG: hypothetical protein ACYDCQ_07820 [Dehalococcoidia bacterium]